MDWDEITLAANLCLFSYEDFTDDINKEALSSLGILVDKVSIHNIKNASTTVSFSKSNESLYITWRGTDQLNDWWNNINIKPLKAYINDVSLGKVHTGLWNYYLTLQKMVNMEIDNYIKMGGKRIVFSGYSLGASICYSAIETTLRLRNVDVMLYLFASPKLGDKTFMNSFVQYCPSYIHIILDADVVPTLPFFSQFVSFQKTYKLEANNKNICQNCFVKFLNCWVFQNVLKNHAISNYVNILNALNKTTGTHIKGRNSYERNSIDYDDVRRNYNKVHTFDSRLTITPIRLVKSA